MLQHLQQDSSPQDTAPDQVRYSLRYWPRGSYVAGDKVDIALCLLKHLPCWITFDTKLKMSSQDLAFEYELLYPEQLATLTGLDGFAAMFPASSNSCRRLPTSVPSDLGDE